MEKGRIFPLVLISLSIMILVYRYTNLFPKYFVYIIIPLLFLIPIAIILNRRVIRLNSISINSNIFDLITQDDRFCGEVLRIIGKTDLSSRSLVEDEIRKLGMSLARRQGDFHYVFTTSISNGKMGSALIVFKSCKPKLEKDQIEKEVTDIKNIAKAISPHLELIPTSISSTPVPLPSLFGNVPYLYAPEKTFSAVSNEPLVFDYDIPLGRVQNDLASNTGINLKDVTRHIGIFGTTGSGKSTTACHLSLQVLKKNVDVVILDWHGEYSRSIPNNVSYTLYNANKVLRIDLNSIISKDINDAVEIFGDTMQLTDPQRFLLYTVLNKLKKSPELNFKNLIEILRSIEETSNWIRDVKYALARKFFILLGKEGREIFSHDGLTVDNLGNFFNGLTIVDLSFIRNMRLRKLYGLLIMKLISDFYIEAKTTKMTMVVIDEAHNYFADKNDFTDRLISEIRKYGVSLCVISQSPSSLSSEIMKNTNIKIIHSIKSDIDKKSIKDSLSLDDKMISSLDKLDVGEAILSAPNIKNPIIIKIESNCNR
ncbi:ATP-binding protein [Sulfuracidifex tepidarius]|uniref:DNA double-strand break repair helicase HerA n=1 Tax=Sulfuracidifex tepidarius TaxID=1294262 RepID=A0A510DWW1_9CREN|nr:ATP-binding protein [Sulfuracidifex tepidarius]BBG24458.1 DNA double-strand break repair helicase HerA [Sulfuracidifex tepidarius]BBG27216.1 DNA double-strand break repair helicase HerA [Sulfuracidifex tepidarius]